LWELVRDLEGTLRSDIARSWTFAEVRQQYEKRDVILYALGLGLGGNPLDTLELKFVTEGSLCPLPTVGTVLARTRLSEFLAAVGIVRSRVVQAAQRAIFDQPFAPEGEVVSRARVTGLWDKGPGRGAVIAWDQETFDSASGRRLCLLSSLTFARGDGGCGGDEGGPPSPHTMPAEEPHFRLDYPTLPQAALIYRQCGDLNPLHCDPEAARRAGFERPILHGLCSYGIAGWAVLRHFAEGRPERLAALECRFVRPVFPGDVLRMEMWRHSDTISFRMRSLERDVIALDHGRAMLRS
jgi:acyl dehydratase